MVLHDAEGRGNVPGDGRALTAAASRTLSLGLSRLQQLGVGGRKKSGAVEASAAAVSSSRRRLEVSQSLSEPVEVAPVEARGPQFATATAMARHSARRRCGADRAVSRSRALLAGGLMAASAANGSAEAVQGDGSTTYCWRSDAATGAEDAVSTACGVALTLAVETVEESQGLNITLSVAPSPSSGSSGENFAVACGLEATDNETQLTAEIYPSCLQSDACNPFAVDREDPVAAVALSRDAASEWTQQVVLAQTFVRMASQQKNVSFLGQLSCIRSSGEAYTATVFGRPRESVSASSVIAPEVDGSATTTTVMTLSDNHMFGMTGSLFTVVVVVLLVALVCVAAGVVVWIRRRSRTQAKAMQAPESPETGESNLRFSDWSQVYATSDGLPSSILLDDRTTLAILRASAVSPRRRVADFTRDVAVWDERSSASPITPGSCILSGPPSLSPANSFVLMESGERGSLPLQDALQFSDSEDERLEVDV